MITIIARFKCQEGKEAEGEKILREMVESVKREESGAVAYICHRSRQNPGEIFFYEIYESEEARQAHRKTPHMAKMNENFAKYFSPPVQVEELERVGGFIRTAVD